MIAKVLPNIEIMTNCQVFIFSRALLNIQMVIRLTLMEAASVIARHEAMIDIAYSRKMVYKYAKSDVSKNLQSETSNLQSFLIFATEKYLKWRAF